MASKPILVDLDMGGAARVTNLPAPSAASDAATKAYADSVGGGGGGATFTAVEIDFGATPVVSKAFTITDAAVSTTSKILAVQSGKAATGRDADENELDALIARANPGTGNFTLWVDSITGPVTGKYVINYTVGA